MTPDFDKIRTNLQKVMQEKQLNAAAWSKKAGMHRNTLTMFLNKHGKTLEMETLAALATAADVRFADLVDIDVTHAPPPQDLMLDALLMTQRYFEKSALDAATLKTLARDAALIASQFGNNTLNHTLLDYLKTAKNIKVPHKKES